MNSAVINHKDGLLALQKVIETLGLNTGMQSAITGDFKNSYQWRNIRKKLLKLKKKQEKRFGIKGVIIMIKKKKRKAWNHIVEVVFNKLIK